MTPAARIAAAIDVLDAILEGHGVERALTHWARGSRFAGSKDRAAVRDHVYDALRRKASCLAVTRGHSGRDWMRGLLHITGVPLGDVFGVDAHAPAALQAGEDQFFDDLDTATAHDIPAWLWDRWCADLGDQAQEVAQTLWSSAMVHLRVNLAKTTRQDAIAQLVAEGIDCDPHPQVETAIVVAGRSGKVTQSQAYKSGLVEVQDASSQASIMVLPRDAGGPVLDYCAGGGGKSLALAAWLGAQVDAYDIAPARMRDIPERAKRAGVDVAVLHDLHQISDTYKTVFVDAPCSGSGTWRRDPAGKWALTPDRLSALCTLQRDILGDVHHRVAPDGHLVYATCSVLACENVDQMTWFCDTFPQWQIAQMHQFVPTSLGDGFFVTHLTQK